MDIQNLKNVILSSQCTGFDLRSQVDSIRNWVTKRSEAIEDCMQQSTSIREIIVDGNSTITQMQMDALVRIRFVDEEGVIHGLYYDQYDPSLEHQDSAGIDGIPQVFIWDYLAGEHGAFKFYDPEFAPTFIDWLDAMDETATAQCTVMEYVSLCTDAITDNGEIAATAITAGLQSTDSRIRELAQNFSANGGATTSAFLQYIQQGMLGLSKLTSTDSTDDVGYHFDIEQYSASGTTDILCGVWSLLGDAAGAVASIAMIAGQGVIAAVAGIVWAVGQVTSRVVQLIRDKTTYSMGTGTSMAYALAVKNYIPVSAFVTVPTSEWHEGVVHLPWGHILWGNIVEHGGRDCIPMLIYPNACMTNITPLGPMPHDYGAAWGKIINENETDFYAYMNMFTSTQRTAIFVEPEDKWQVFNYVCANLGAIAWWMALQMLPYARSEVWVSHRLLNYASVVRTEWIDDYANYSEPAYYVAYCGVADDRNNAWASHISTAPPQHNTWPNHISPDDFFTFMQNFIWADKDGFSGTQGFWRAVEICSQRLWSSCGMIAPSYNSLTAIYGHQLFHNLLDISVGKSTKWCLTGAATSWSSAQKCIDYLASGSDRPEIITDPLVTPAALDKRSFIIACALTITTAALVTTTAFVVRRKIRNAKRAKVLRLEQDAIAAQEAFKSDPSAQNTKAYLKAQRKFNRRANKMGYSSNNVGSFTTSSPTSMSELSEKLTSLTPTDDTSSAQFDLIYQIVTGRAIPH